MAIDPRIALGFQQPEYHSPINALAGALQVQGLARQNELGALDMQERKAAAAEREGLRNYLSGSPSLDTPEGQAGLYKVAPTQAGAILKSRQDISKEAAAQKKLEVDTKGAELKQKHDAITFNLQALGGVSNPQQAAEWINGGVKSGLIGMQQAQQSLQGLQTESQTPQGFEEWKQKQKAAGMTLAQQSEQAMKQLEFAYRQKNDAANRGVTIRGQDLSAETTRRGQNMVDTRSRETTAATLTKPFEVTGPDGLPLLVQQDKQGNITPVQGFGPKSGSAKPLNDTQAKALLFGTRMQEANKTLEGIEGKYSPAAINAKTGAENLPLIGGLAGMAGNYALSEQDQQAEQAQRDFINAVLRRESGAVISEAEFANAKKQYFPQPNDKTANLEQKSRNRKLAIDGLLAEVPEGRRASITPKPTGAGFSDADKERRYQEWKAQQK